MGKKNPTLYTIGQEQHNFQFFINLSSFGFIENIS